MLGALRAPFEHLWGHITVFVALLFFGRFVRCVFLTFRLPRDVQMLVGGMRAALWGIGETTFRLHD